MSAVAGLLLAAGGGRRMGGPKALVEVDGQPLVERCARVLADAGCAPVLVVLGARAADARARLETPATVVINADWPSGMASSLQSGLGALPEDARAVAIMLVDQPRIGAEAVRRLVAAWERGASAAVATYDGRQRNPVVLDRSLWAEAAAAATGDTGARALLRARPELVTPVPCDDVADPYDVDVPEDLAALPHSPSSD